MEAKGDVVGRAVGSAVVVVGAAVATWWTRRKKRRPILHKHPFFRRCEETQAWARHLPIEDAMRREAFQDLLQFKLEFWRKDLHRLVTTFDFSKLSAEELAEILHTFINATVTRYSDAAREQGIPALIVDKFSEWHFPAVIGAHNFIDAICDSDWRTTEEMVAAMLSWMIGALEQTVDHAEITLADLNGEVDGHEYKGLIAQHYESPRRRRWRRSRSTDAH